MISVIEIRGNISTLTYCITIVRLLFFCLRVSNRDQLADDKILFREPLIPALQSTHLLLAQTLEVIKWPIKVLCQHILIKAAARQSPTRIATREIGIRSAGTVEVAARCHVEHAAFDC